MLDSAHALIVDDEAGVRFFVERTLQRAGYIVATAASGEEALAQLRETSFDLLVLDLRLGGQVNGQRVLEAVRWRWPETAVVILTAHGSLESALDAIREGVDGYLLKPVEGEELLTTVQTALARRRPATLAAESPPHRSVWRWRDLTIDLDKHQAARGDQPLQLTPHEFRVLAHLMQKAPQVVSPQELVQAALGYECQDLHEARAIIKWYIHRLRRKVEPDPAHPRYILNVRGVGYTLGDPEV